MLSPEFQEKLNSMRNYIKDDKKWFEAIKIKAQQQNISVDSMVTLDAIWVLQHDKN